MSNKLYISLGVSLLSIVFFGCHAALAKVKVSTAAKTVAHYTLPMLAAEEQKFWEKEGVEVEWVPFNSGGAQAKALAAGAVEFAIFSISNSIVLASRGVPAVLVADFKYEQPWLIVVLKGSPIKSPAALKGTRIAITRTGSLSHIYGRVAAKALGLEKEVKFVATGGVPQQLAALKAGAVDAVALSLGGLANLIFGGEVREVVNISRYLPKGGTDVALTARKEVGASQPEAITRVIKALLRATQYVVAERQWSIERLKTEIRFSQEAAEGIFKTLRYSTDPRVSREVVADYREFLIAYGQATEKETPPAEGLFTNRYVP